MSYFPTSLGATSTKCGGERRPTRPGKTAPKASEAPEGKTWSPGRWQCRHDNWKWKRGYWVDEVGTREYRKKEVLPEDEEEVVTPPTVTWEEQPLPPPVEKKFPTTTVLLIAGGAVALLVTYLIFRRKK